MKSIYILGAGNFAQEVYSEVFLQGNASQFGKFQGYIYLSKLNNPILIDEERKKLDQDIENKKKNLALIKIFSKSKGNTISKFNFIVR